MKAGRPRKQKPWRPGAPAPIQAAGCGPERRLTVPSPAKHGTLRLTPTGYAQDLLGTWRRRKQKRSHRNPGATIINDRQYEAGRAIEHMIDAMAGKGNLRSFDLTVPVVDQSFRHRQGGDPKFRDAYDRLAELEKHLVLLRQNFSRSVSCDIRSDLLLELLIVALDAPAQFGEIDQLAEADLLRQGREPVFGRFLFALRPLDQQPLLRSVFSQAVTMSNQNAHPRKARAQPVGRTFPPLDLAPGFLR